MINVSYEKEFVFHDGKRAKNLVELAGIIEKLSDSEFSQFVNPYKNDFANWVNDVVMDYDLAAKLRKTFSKDETSFIINNRLSSIIVDSHVDSHDTTIEVPTLKSLETVHKSSGIIGGIFKKKDEKKTEDKKLEYRRLEDKKAEEKKRLEDKKQEEKAREIKTTLTEPKRIPEQHEISSHTSFVHKETKLLDGGEESSENVLWMLTYGLVIGLILILIMYRFLF